MLKFVGKLVARKAPVVAGFPFRASGLKVESARVDTDSPQASPSPRSSLPLMPETPIPARYNLGSARNVAQDGGLPSLSSPAVRTPTYPTELSSAWPKQTHRGDKMPSRHTRSVTIGSSRDLEKHEQAHLAQSESLNLEPPLSRAARERNHHRGYLDRSMGGTPRKTLPGPALLSPFKEQTPTRSSDPAQGQPSLFSRFTAQSMARMNSASSTASGSDSSSLATPLTSAGPSTPISSDDKPSINDNYSQFLNR